MDQSTTDMSVIADLTAKGVGPTTHSPPYSPLATHMAVTQMVVGVPAVPTLPVTQNSSLHALCEPGTTCAVVTWFGLPYKHEQPRAAQTP